MSFKYEKQRTFNVETQVHSVKEAPVLRSSTTIEIAPGDFQQLRGAQETYAAIGCDFYVFSSCSICNQTICCIEYAAYVLCPRCRVVSPIDGFDSGSDERSGGGVGLGFTLDELAEWQEEITVARLHESTRW